MRLSQQGKTSQPFCVDSIHFPNYGPVIQPPKENKISAHRRGYAEPKREIKTKRKYTKGRTDVGLTLKLQSVEINNTCSFVTVN